MYEIRIVDERQVLAFFNDEYIPIKPSHLKRFAARWHTTVKSFSDLDDRLVIVLNGDLMIDPEYFRKSTAKKMLIVGP